MAVVFLVPEKVTDLSSRQAQGGTDAEAQRFPLGRRQLDDMGQADLRRPNEQSIRACGFGDEDALVAAMVDQTQDPVRVGQWPTPFPEGAWQVTPSQGQANAHQIAAMGDENHADIAVREGTDD